MRFKSVRSALAWFIDYDARQAIATEQAIKGNRAPGMLTRDEIYAELSKALTPTLRQSTVKEIKILALYARGRNWKVISKRAKCSNSTIGKTLAKKLPLLWVGLRGRDLI